MTSSERNLEKEIEELGIIAIEDAGSVEDVFAALDAIREHNRQYPPEKLAEMIQEDMQAEDWEILK